MNMNGESGDKQERAKQTKTPLFHVPPVRLLPLPLLDTRIILYQNRSRERTRSDSENNSLNKLTFFFVFISCLAFQWDARGFGSEGRNLTL